MPDQENETYNTSVLCTNCKECPRFINIKMGQTIDNTICPICGCKTLIKKL